MKYEKDFFMKINCHANEWRETLRLEGSKNKWRIFYNKMDNNKYIYFEKLFQNRNNRKILAMTLQVVLLINSNTFLQHYSKTQQWNIKKPSIYFCILFLLFQLSYKYFFFYLLSHLTKQIWRCIHWHTLFVIFNKLNL